MTHSELTIKIELACAEVLPYLPQPKPIKGDESPRQRSQDNRRMIMKHINEAAERHGIDAKFLVKIILR